MKSSLLIYLSGVVTCLLLDFLFLGILMGPVYRRELAPLLRMQGGKPNLVLWAAGLAYVLIPLGVQQFVLPKVRGLSWLATFSWGMLFGLVVYGVYEMTNYSIVKDWSFCVIWLDTVWGCVLCGLVTLLMSRVESAR